ncbi:MAG TPA: glycosyltransferase family 4 protein [Candidatus Acidoferrales bacterium]|nr:glycosyltransferase family 4 protein [Candidatus Acidoferrales bacterium]
MRLVVALPAVFSTDWGIAMFNRALLLALSEYCQRHGAEASVLALNDSTSQLDPRYVTSPAVRFRGFERRKASFVLAFLQETWSGANLVILGHVNLLPMALALRRSVPYWLIAHGDEAWVRLPALSRRALRRAQAVLAVSDYTRKRLAAENGLSGEGWQVFPNTLDPFFRRVAADPTGRPTLLSVSRLKATERESKGVAQALEALPELRRRFPDLQYVMVGDGDDRPWLEKRAQHLGVAGGVLFTGHVAQDELMRRYAACDVFVLPSNQEGFGIVFLEAMAHGKPVVAARAGGTPEVVADGETGLLVEPGNRAALVVALSELLAHPERGRQLGEAGRRRLEANFTFELFRRRLIRLLETR